MVYPGYYKPRKYADSYRYINFALLDFVKQDAGEGKQRVDMLLEVVNYKGDVVISRSYPLLKMRKEGIIEQEIDSSLSTRQHAADIRAQTSENEHGVICEPIGGPVPIWRIFLMKACLTTFILVVVITPVVLLVYYAVLALYYICMGREYKRRTKIEQGYWDNKQKLV
ncbi:hypothetical protein EON65_57925 [archaeon]|nr:MAG: hypothetical protein EON65_57925 [archaeon]